MLAITAIATGLSGGLFVAYKKFQEISATPSPISEQGEARLYFDEPNVSAYLKVAFKEDDYGVKADYHITLEGKAARKGIGFTLLLTGGAQYLEHFQGGELIPRENGCPSSHAYVTSEVKQYSCAWIPLADSWPPISGTDPRAQIIRGIIKTNSIGSAWASVTTSRIKAIVSSTAGKRTYFSLPAVGTTYLPRSLDGRQIEFDITKEVKGFVPQRLDLSIDYGKIPVQSRIESIAPDLVQAGQFLWFQEDAGLIRAEGSTVDTVVEEAGQRVLFLLGLYAGFVAGVIPPLMSVGFRLFRKTRT
ncbi:hypothetical protein ACIBQ6_16150 [Nonomuraea sp. NPDC049655]|uniref:hypothetical protein n=1 Tax=Nonomuraea sp. NPDC049655 TaxID=3364355 RepID=UPI0037B1EC23